MRLDNILDISLWSDQNPLTHNIHWDKHFVDIG